MNKIIERIITFGIILLVGSTIAKEMEKQLPKELRINYKKIILQAIIFGITIGLISYFIASILL